MNETLELAPIGQMHAAPLAPTTTGALAEQSPAAIMLAALAKGVSPADLRDMLALQREWQADQARAAFHEALAAFKAERIVVAKDKLVDYTPKSGGGRVRYKHAELVDVVEAVSPVLARFGLSFRWDVKQSKDCITVICILSHKLGHSERVEMSGPPDTTGNKNALQQIASATSYLQRYTLKAITGVAEGGEDDDGQGGAPSDQQQGEQQAAGSEQPDPTEAMRTAGWTQAQKGMASLTAWWKGLGPKDQAALSKDFGEMRKTARRLDQENNRG